MKKYVKLISLVLVVVLFATLASSCGISRIKNLISGFFETPIEELPLEERTKKVLEKISQKTDETSSVDMELSMIFEGMAIDGSEFKFTVNGESKYRELESGFQYSQNQTISMIVPGKASEVTTYESGYYNGKMYENVVDSSSVTKVYSELSADEYKAHMNENFSSDGIDLQEGDFEITSCDKNNNEWVIVITNFSEYGVQTIQKELLSDIESLVAQTHIIDDLVFTIKADNDFNLKGYEIDAVFKTIEAKYDTRPVPVLSFSYEMTDMGSTEPLKKVDFTGYTRVDDLRIYDVVNKALNDKIDDEYCELYSKIETKVSLKNGSYSTTQTSKNIYDGSFENKEDGFKFNFKYTADSKTSTITYENLEQIVDNGSYEKTTTYKTDHTARMFVDEIIDPVGFRINGLIECGVFDEEEGIYKFQFKNGSQYTSESLGVSVKSDTAILKVTMKDGEITNLDYALNIVTTNGITLEVNITCQYN